MIDAPDADTADNLELWEGQRPGFFTAPQDAPPNPSRHISNRDIQASFTIHQGSYGDCQTLTVMTSLDLLKTPEGVEYGERYLADMIRELPNGDYQVKFPGYPEPITVSAADKLKYAGGVYGLSGTTPEAETLPRKLEIAFLKLHDQTDSVPNPFKLFLGQDAHFYGMPASYINSSFAKTLLQQGHEGRDLIINAHLISDDRNKIVTIQSQEQPPRTIKLPVNHSYSIQVENGKFYVINPHDSKDKIPVTAEQISTTFTNLYVAGGPGTKLQIPGNMADAAKASEDYANNMFKQYASIGAFSIADKRGKNTPESAVAGKRAVEAKEQFEGAARNISEQSPAPPTPPPPPPAPQPAPVPAPRPAPIPEPLHLAHRSAIGSLKSAALSRDDMELIKQARLHPGNHTLIKTEQNMLEAHGFNTGRRNHSHNRHGNPSHKQLDGLRGVKTEQAEQQALQSMQRNRLSPPLER